MIEVNKYTAANGITFNDADREEWASEAESDQAFVGEHKGTSIPGRSVSVGEEARPFTLRLDEGRRAKLSKVAHDRHV